MSDEDGFGAEHAKQHRLDVSQADGHILQILFSHTRESTRKKMQSQGFLLSEIYKKDVHFTLCYINELILTSRRRTKCSGSPGVVVNHFALRFDKSVVDDFHLRVDDCYPGQLQALFCVTLKKTKKKTLNNPTVGKFALNQVRKIYLY